jgi:HD-like signal output (HDOD) protein
MNATDIVKDIDKLFSLPEVCYRLHELLEDPHNNVSDIARLISQDADLTARLLKIANSSMYGFSGRIDSLERAISVIGTNQLLILVLATSSVMTFPRIPGEFFNMASFWRHSAYCGVVARLLAQRCHVLHPERLFVAGLLHDIGLLALCVSHADLARNVMDTVHESGQAMHVIEQIQLGFDHTDVGSELLKKWGLPEGLQAAVRGHHQPGQVKNHALEAAIVHIATAFTHIAEDDSDENDLHHVDPAAWQLTGLENSIMDEVLREAGPQFDELLGVIIPRQYH